MNGRPLLAAALLALALAAGSCAVQDTIDTTGQTTFAPPPSLPEMAPVSAARMGLQPAYRPFYDALVDEGDWVLVEPYGWVFRPRVNFVAWRPYQDGWWEPSDVYGWVWNSNETFGWITYHYGEWFYDDYQGWVWTPGPVWGPAWVAWVGVDDWIGWAPLAPAADTNLNGVPGGLFTYVNAAQFTARDLSQSAMFVRSVPVPRGRVTEIANIAHIQGIPINRGPDESLLARMGSPIPQRVDVSRIPRLPIQANTASANEASLLARTRAMVNAGIREMVAAHGGGGTPPPATPNAGPLRRPPAQPVSKPALRDTTVKKGPAPPADSAAAAKRDAKGQIKPRPVAKRDSTDVR